MLGMTLVWAEDCVRGGELQAGGVKPPLHQEKDKPRSTAGNGCATNTNRTDLRIGHYLMTAKECQGEWLWQGG